MSDFVPRDFEVPTQVDTDLFHVRVLSPQWAEMDFQAVIESKPFLPKIFSDPTWPGDVHDFESNLRFIKEDHDDFVNRRGFSYILLSPDHGRCLGCLYLFPSIRGDYEASVFYWVHAKLMGTPFELAVDRFAHTWVQEAWPFRKHAFPGRDIPWAEWTNLAKKCDT